MELLNELENVVNLTYWEHGHKGIFLFQDGLCAHIKMSREKFDEIQDKYYGNKLKNIISDSGIKNKQNRKKRINWEGFENLYNQGYDYREIAEILNCGVASVVRKVSEDIHSGTLKPRSRGMFSDSEKVKILKKMKSENKTLIEISKYFKCNKSTVVKAIKVLVSRNEL